MAFEEARNSLRLRDDEPRVPQQEDRGDDPEDRIRGRELNYYWHNLLGLVEGGDDIPDSNGSTDSASGEPEEEKKKFVFFTNLRKQSIDDDDEQESLDDDDKDSEEDYHDSADDEDAKPWMSNDEKLALVEKVA